MAGDLASWDEKVDSYWTDILLASAFKIDVPCTLNLLGVRSLGLAILLRVRMGGLRWSSPEKVAPRENLGIEESVTR